MRSSNYNLFGIPAPFITGSRFESIAVDALNKHGLLPKKPEHVPIEIFSEQEWDVTEEPLDLPQGVLGYISFSKEGVSSIGIARFLMEGTDTITTRRCRSTLAHEIAHGLLHGGLFIQLLSRQESEAKFSLDLNTTGDGLSSNRILCRSMGDDDQQIQHSPWYEVQANKLMGCLLLPWGLLMEAALPISRQIGCVSSKGARKMHVEQAEYELSNLFNVSRRMVQLRLHGWWEEQFRQPTLF